MSKEKTEDRIAIVSPIVTLLGVLTGCVGFPISGVVLLFRLLW